MERTGPSLTLVTLMLFTLINVGRIQELYPWLAPYHVGDIVGMATVLFFLAEYPHKDWIQVFKTREMKYMIGLYILAVLSVPFSAWPGMSFKFITADYPQLLLYFFIIACVVQSMEDYRRIAWALLASVSLLTIFTVMEKIPGRVSVTWTYDPNDLAFVLVVALPVSVFFFSENKGVKKVLIGGIIALSLIAILLTMSRGGFVALVIVSLFLLFKGWRKRPLTPLMYFIVVGIILMNFAPQGFWERMSTILHPETEYDQTLGGRTIIWRRGIDMMLENPVFGVGANAFHIAEGLSHADIGGKWSTAHNSFIQIGAELGVIGLLLFIGLIYTSIKSMRALRRLVQNDPQFGNILWLTHAIEVGLIGYMVAGFFLSQAYSSILYFLLGLGVSLKKILMQTVEVSSKQ
jgi:probable O-glycosylation ligase (exosortase A-associated)